MTLLTAGRVRWENIYFKDYSTHLQPHISPTRVEKCDFKSLIFILLYRDGIQTTHKFAVFALIIFKVNFKFSTWNLSLSVCFCSEAFYPTCQSSSSRYWLISSRLNLCLTEWGNFRWDSTCQHDLTRPCESEARMTSAAAQRQNNNDANIN